MYAEKEPKYKSMFVRLVEDELGFCCVYAFLKETKRYSGRKVALAMGVSSQVIRYWRDKKFHGEIIPCPQCPRPQTQLRLRKTKTGRIYFKRCSL